MKINLHDIADKDIIKTLFAENPGVVIQVSDAHKDELKAFLEDNGIGYAKIGYPAPELRKIIIKKDGFEHEFDITPCATTGTRLLTSSTASRA